MSDSGQEPPTTPDAPTPSPWLVLLRRILPYALTALVAVGLSLALLPLAAGSGVALAPTPAPAPTSPPEAAPPATPVLTATPAGTPRPQPQPDPRILSQEIIDLRAELRSMRSMFYLGRAATQLADAEIALNVNDTAQVERMLVVAKVSLDRAYNFSAEGDKGPIGEFQLRIGELLNDLRVRPDDMDQRLRSLRQNLLSLVDQ